MESVGLMTVKERRKNLLYYYFLFGLLHRESERERERERIT